jgi:hypothetical protein
MNIKTVCFVAILVFAAAFAPAARADTDSFVLDVQGTDFPVLSFSASAGKLDTVLPLELGSAALFADVVAAAPLGTITLEISDDGVLQETLSFTNAVATSFLLGSSGGQVVDTVGFKFQREVATMATIPAPEPSALALLALGILCAAGVSLRRVGVQR